MKASSTKVHLNIQTFRELSIRLGLRMNITWTNKMIRSWVPLSLKEMSLRLHLRCFLITISNASLHWVIIVLVKNLRINFLAIQLLLVAAIQLPTILLIYQRTNANHNNNSNLTRHCLSSPHNLLKTRNHWVFRRGWGAMKTSRKIVSTSFRRENPVMPVLETRTRAISHRTRLAWTIYSWVQTLV